jgi:hypothetical protein
VLILSHLDAADRPGEDGGPMSVADGAIRAAVAAADGTAVPLGDPEPVTLKSATELVDALPYLLGYRPEDSMVLVAVHDRSGLGAFGGRARLGIPDRREDWPEAARQMARGLVHGCERRGLRPEAMLAFVYRDPKPGRTGREVMETLRPLAQLLRTECGSLDVPVLEALCVSDGRFWSYCCPSGTCCPPDGTPMSAPGSSVLSAALTYAGLQVRGTPREFRARLLPWETAAARDQEAALDAASASLVSRILDEARRDRATEEILDLADRLRERLATAPPVHGSLESDQRDDELLSHDEAATLLVGLQDRSVRDRAAEWMEGSEAVPALRLWRALARRCVGAYGAYSAAPLTLVGWVAWSLGDELEAREALAMALGVDSRYIFARLLHHACNEGLDPESIRRCLRAERARRAASTHRAEKGRTTGAPEGADPGKEARSGALTTEGARAGSGSAGAAMRPDDGAAGAGEGFRAGDHGPDVPSDDRVSGAGVRPASRRPRRPEPRGPGRGGPGRGGPGHSSPGHRGPVRSEPRKAQSRGSGPARRGSGASRPPGRRTTGRE